MAETPRLQSPWTVPSLYKVYACLLHHGQRSWAGYSSWGRRKSETIEQLSTRAHTHTPPHHTPPPHTHTPPPWLQDQLMHCGRSARCKKLRGSCLLAGQGERARRGTEGAWAHGVSQTVHTWTTLSSCGWRLLQLKAISAEHKPAAGGNVEMGTGSCNCPP